MARPIVLGVEGEAAKFIQQADAGVCMEPENAEDLLRLVTAFADKPEWGRRLGQAGHHYVTRLFDRQKLAVDYLEIVGNTCDWYRNSQAIDKKADPHM